MFINIGLHGYGGEVVLGKVSKKSYDFWTSEEGSELFSEYVWGPDWFSENNPDFKVPKFAELPNWYDIDDIAHESGATWGHCRLYIREMEGLDYRAKEIKEIFDGDLQDFLIEHELEVDWEEAHPQPKKYTFYGYSSEKGTFWEGTTEIEDKEFDPKKLTFSGSEIYQDELIYYIEYEGVEYLNNDGGGTDGKSSGFELIGPNDF